MSLLTSLTVLWPLDLSKSSPPSQPSQEVALLLGCMLGLHQSVFNTAGCHTLYVVDDRHPQFCHVAPGSILHCLMQCMVHGMETASICAARLVDGQTNHTVSWAALTGSPSRWQNFWFGPKPCLLPRMSHCSDSCLQQSFIGMHSSQWFVSGYALTE